jgi:putative PIN family toxin of toxin-antitoxin system
MTTKAVLDSSVLVSAFLTPKGVTGQLLRAAHRGAFDLWLSENILQEIAAVLERPKIAKRYRPQPGAAHAFCIGLAGAASLVDNLSRIRAVPSDPKDDMVLATAVAAGANYLVTGDRRHLLPLREYEGIRIVTPRQFLDLIG